MIALDEDCSATAENEDVEEAEKARMFVAPGMWMTKPALSVAIKNVQW